MALLTNAESGTEPHNELQKRLASVGIGTKTSSSYAELRAMLRQHLETRDRPWPYEVTKLSDRTWVIVENDRFGEQPHIYIVLGKKKAIVIDTGCNTDNLMDFLCTLPELDCLQFQVINTHIHYDHIMGNHSFCKPGGSSLCGQCVSICQGARDRQFSKNWQETSLQQSVGAEIETFCVTQWLEEGQKIYLDDDTPQDDEALEVLFTPGHTPDSISLYLPHENRLFTGDLIYPGSIYLFLPGSRLDEFAQSIDKLGNFIKSKPAALTLSCGHITARLHASCLTELHDVLALIENRSVAPTTTRISWHKEPLAMFQTGMFSLLCREEDVSPKERKKDAK